MKVLQVGRDDQRFPCAPPLLKCRAEKAHIFMISLPSLGRWGQSSATRRIEITHILYEFTIFIAYLVRELEWSEY
jgi:hypothetical protein